MRLSCLNEKLDPHVEELLNKRVNSEMFSSYAYLAMSAWFETTAFPGFTAWADGVIPFNDPFADAGVYDPCDSDFAFPQALHYFDGQSHADFD